MNNNVNLFDETRMQRMLEAPWYLIYLVKWTPSTLIYICPLVFYTSYLWRSICTYSVTSIHPSIWMVLFDETWMQRILQPPCYLIDVWSFSQYWWNEHCQCKFTFIPNWIDSNAEDVKGALLTVCSLLGKANLWGTLFINTSWYLGGKAIEPIKPEILPS